MSRILVLVNGSDSIVALGHAVKNYPDDDVIGIWYDLGFPYSKERGLSLPDFVVKHPMTHYAKSMKTTEVGDIVQADLPYEPMIWDCIVRHRADKVILGVIKTDRQIEQNTQGWVDKFNKKFDTDIVQYPLLEMGLDKVEVLQYGMKMKVGKEMLSSMPCIGPKHGRFGCGGCIPCIRKRSAMLTLGRLPNVPKPIENLSGDTVGIMLDYQSYLLSGHLIPNLKEMVAEIMPALVEAYEEEDPIKLEKKIRKQFRKNNR